MIIISEVPPSDPSLLKLIRVHKAYCVNNTPKGSGHAVTPSMPSLTGIRYWVARQGDLTAGCIGLKAMGDSQCEIKTMHVLPVARGAGLGQNLIETIIADCAQSGINRVCLETGAGDGFAASRRLYERIGFKTCAAFGDYVDDPFSICMARDL